MNTFLLSPNDFMTSPCSQTGGFCRRFWEVCDSSTPRGVWGARFCRLHRSRKMISNSSQRGRNKNLLRICSSEIAIDHVLIQKHVKTNEKYWWCGGLCPHLLAWRARKVLVDSGPIYNIYSSQLFCTRFSKWTTFLWTRSCHDYTFPQVLCSDVSLCLDWGTFVLCLCWLPSCVWPPISKWSFVSDGLLSLCRAFSLHWFPVSCQNKTFQLGK